MANASKKHMGAGAKGKGDGTGARVEAASIPENMVLSNRDKAQHPADRGRTANGSSRNRCTTTS